MRFEDATIYIYFDLIFNVIELFRNFNSNGNNKTNSLDLVKFW